MSRSVCIYPIGSIDDSLLKRVAECIETTCGLDCSIGNALKRPGYAFNEVRSQYDSKLILKDLPQKCGGDAHIIMGVTNVDLYVSILKYVYGCAQIGGRCSIISLYRLRPEFYDKASNPHTLLTRLKKTALHELGHTIGLTHCRNRECVMFSSVNIADTDHKLTGYCPTCTELFKWFRNGADPGLK